MSLQTENNTIYATRTTQELETIGCDRPLLGLAGRDVGLALITKDINKGTLTAPGAFATSLLLGLLGLLPFAFGDNEMEKQVPQVLAQFEESPSGCLPVLPFVIPAPSLAENITEMRMILGHNASVHQGTSLQQLYGTHRLVGVATTKNHLSLQRGENPSGLCI